MGEFELLISEARERLEQDIAENVEDVVFQLEDEGLCIRSFESGALKRLLQTEGWE